ncbi:OTU domain-containing protein 3-like [Actinia tenebrosa]|uniref:OTU domain-containing protein 3-like n=1 Tax=Actinia tenebrosa TaxID=6105 RepID=A0A6P8HHJ0_ACTTE|nr:OTU domain-containing protein 3-like [Actinia tenebrosa]
MAKGNTVKKKGQKRDELERKRDERCRRKALKKERNIKEYLENDENFVSFKNQLEAVGLKIKDILGDGNCLFRALGDQLNGDHTSHAYHRRNTVQYMKDHRDDFEPFMEDGVTFDKHLAELSKLGTYGGNDSIVAFARNNGVDIVIHQLNNPRWVIHGSEFSKSQQKIELHLAYHNGEHYSSVRRLTDPDDGPAWQYNQKNSQMQSVENPKVTVRKNKKKHERKENQDKSDPSSQANKYIDETSQLVMENTGCQDSELIQHTLQANNYDIDASIMEIIQVMCVLEEQEADVSKGFVRDVIAKTEAIETMATENSVAIEQPSDEYVTRNRQENVGAFVECKSDDVTSRTRLNHDDINDNTKETDKEAFDKLKGDSGELVHDQKTENKLKLHPGARPKENISQKSRNKAPHLTNRQRKDLARQEKKKQREKRRVNERQQQTESETVAQDNVNTIVADLGAVCI